MIGQVKEHRRRRIAAAKRPVVTLFGPRSERSQRLLEQMELQLEDWPRPRGGCGQNRERRHPGRELHAAQGDARNFPVCAARHAAASSLLRLRLRQTMLIDRAIASSSSRSGAADARSAPGARSALRMDQDGASVISPD